MNILLWTLAGLLAAMFLAAGIMKLSQPKQKLVTTPNMAWAEDFSPGMLKTIGAAEVLAAAGLILPAALDVVPILVPLAAVGVALLMVGAAATHARRREGQPVVINAVLIAVAVVIAWGRFGPYQLS
ncbi:MULTISPECIES: DoxX family protein [Nocardioides]|uniref:DoxX family protein n=1 Tax=Nocardioides vastitatis TaxID=2568655 RepID=A0ABW0ZNH5_9ACTN|nr:DoxX family protein [Nocardioides sp.]THI92524.1 DoxX family protein [Nocardioides sp.]